MQSTRTRLPLHSSVITLALQRTSAATVLTFLGAFEKLRKRLLASSCPSVRMQQLGSHYSDFDKT